MGSNPQLSMSTKTLEFIHQLSYHQRGPHFQKPPYMGKTVEMDTGSQQDPYRIPRRRYFCSRQKPTDRLDFGKCQITLKQEPLFCVS